MPVYRLEGYNSGGYHDYRDVKFDGKLEYVRYYDNLEKNIPDTVRYIKVTYPDGTITHENDEFLQNLLNEQSYIESFITVGIEEITEETIEKEKKREDVWSVSTDTQKKNSIKHPLEQGLDLFYKTRYLLVLPLLYLISLWIEGTPVRVVLPSTACTLTSLLLLSYSAVFVKKTNLDRYPVLFLFFNTLFVISFLYLFFYDNFEVNKDFEIAMGIFLGLFAIHFVYWFVSLLSNENSDSIFR